MTTTKRTQSDRSNRWSRRFDVVGARADETAKLIRREGVRALTQRLLRRAYLKSGASTLVLGLEHGEVADSTTISWEAPSSRPERGKPIRATWLTTPPAAGSGGHTTMFRVVQGLVDAGHQCTLALYDRHRGRVERHRGVIREAWPWLNADVEDVRQGLSPADVFIATSWESAHVLGARGSVPGRRMYFIQDFEPFFYGQGSEYALSEDTYRFGFTCISVGRMVAKILRERVGVDTVVAEHGCDTSVYSLYRTEDRNGVAFYAKPDFPRRGYALGVLALEEFHRLHPEQEIHLFGEPVGRLPFPVTHHGRMRPDELANLYNACIAGLAMSFTNVSMVPLEMLACGAIPVVNDSPYARADMTNEHVVWAQPSPVAMAHALSLVVTDPARAVRSARGAASVVGGSWDDAKRTVIEAVEREVYG